MTKEEKLKIIATVNCRFEEIETYLDQLEEIEDKEAKEKNSEIDYSQIVTNTRDMLDIVRNNVDWYKATVDERD